MPGIEFTSTFNHDPFVKSANTILNSVKNMAVQIERAGGDMQDVMNGIFDSNKLSKSMDSFFASIIENFGLSTQAADDFKKKAITAIESIAQSGDDATLKVSKITTIIAQLASEAKQIDLNASGADEAKKNLEDMRISANILIDNFNDLCSAADDLEDSLSKNKGKSFDEVKKGVEDYGQSLLDAKEAADKAYAAEEEYAQGIQNQLDEITKKLNTTNDKNLIEQLNKEAEELTVELNSTKVIMEQIKNVSNGLDVKITEYKDVRETVNAFDALNKKLEQYGQILDGIKMGTEEATKAFEEYANKTNSISTEIKGSLKSIAAIAGVAFGLHEIKGFIEHIAQTREYFQDIETSMEVFLGSAEKAADFTSKLKDYAWYNMFEFSDLAKASQQMIAYGQDVDTIIPKLDMLSNVAAGTHAPLMEMVDAYNRAKSTGVVDAMGIKSWATKGVVIRDVLKEMGEAASGTQITFEQLNKVLEHITGDGGMFHDLMKKQLNNISAEKGQLEDNLANMYNEIGEKLQGAITKWYKLQSDMVDNYSEIAGGNNRIDFVVNVAETGMDYLLENWKTLMDYIKEAIVIYGSWRVALVAVQGVHKIQVALWKAEAAAANINSGAITSNTIVKGQATRATVLLDNATKAFNASLLASPLTWWTAGLAAVLYSIYKLTTAETAAAAGVRKANEELEHQSDLLNERKDNINNLINTIKDENQTAYTQLEAYKKLKAIAPEITDAYTQQQLAAMSLDEVMKLLNKDTEDLKYEQAKKNVEEYTEKLEDLKKRFEDFSNNPVLRASDTNNTLYLSYKKSIEDAEAQLKTFREELKRIEDLRKEANTPIEIKIKEAETNANDKQKVLDFYDEAMRLAREVADADDNMSNSVEANAKTNYEVAVQNFDDFIAKVKADLEDPYSIKYGTDKAQEQQFYNELLDLKSKWQGVFNSPIDVIFRMKWQDAKDQAEESHGVAQEGYHWEKSVMLGWVQVKNAEKETIRNKEVIQKELKQVQASIDAMTTEQAKADKKSANGFAARRKALQQELKAYSDTSKDGAKIAKQQADRQARTIQQYLKFKDEIKKLQDNADEANVNARIASIKDEGERERAARKYQHEKTLEDIKSQQDDIFKAIYQERKSEYETQHKNDKNGGHYENDALGAQGWTGVQDQYNEILKPLDQYFGDLGSVTTSQLATIQEAIKNLDFSSLGENAEKEGAIVRAQLNTIFANIATENANNTRDNKKYLDERVQQLRDYMKEYGSLQDQRAAITAEYDQKIAETNDTIQKAALQKQKENLLAELDMKEFRQSINWEAVFNDLDKLSKSALEDLKEKLKKALDMKDITPENAKVLSEKILEIDNRLSDNMWTSMIPALKERARLVNEVKNAEDEIARAQKNFANASAKQTMSQLNLQEVAKTVLGRNLTNDELNAKSGEELAKNNNLAGEAAKKLADAFDKNVTSTTDLKKAQEELTAAQKAAKQANEMLKNLTGKGADGQNLGSSLKSIFTTAAKANDGGEGGFMGYAKLVQTNVNSMAEFTDKIGLAGTNFGDAVHGFADGVNGFMSAIQSLASGDIFGALNGVIDGIGGFFKGLDSLGGGWLFGNDDKYQDALDKWGWVLDTWKDNIAYERELMEKAYGVKAIEATQKAIEAADNAAKAAKEIYEGWAGSGAGLLSSSNGVNVDEGVNWRLLYNYNQDIFNKLGYKRKTFNFGSQELETFSGDVESLFNLTWQELEELKNRAPQFWNSIHSVARDYLDQYIEASKAAEEAVEALKEKLTTTSRDNIFDDFLNSLYELADGSETVMDDIAENWRKMVNKMVINNLIAEDFQKWLTETQDVMVNGIKVGETKSWYDRLANLQEDFYKGIISPEEYKRRLDALMDEYNAKMAEAERKINDFTELGVIKPIDKAAQAVKQLVESMASNVGSAFSDLLSDPTQDVEEWGKDFRNQLIHEFVLNELLGKEYEEWAKEWNEKYINLYNAFKNGEIDEAGYKAGLDALMSDFNGMADGMTERAKQMMDDLGYVFDAEELNSPFNGLRDTFLDTLTNMEDDAEAFKKRLEEVMVKDLIEKQVLDAEFTINGMTFDNFDAYVTDWNKRYIEAVKEGNQAAIDALIEELVQARELTAQAAEELRDRLKKVTSDETFKGMSDNFVSALMDMNKTAEDWATDLGKVMAEKIIKEMIVPTMIQPLLDNLQDVFNGVMDKAVTTDENGQKHYDWQSVIGSEELMSEINKISAEYPEIQAVIKQIMEAFGLSTTNYKYSGFSNLGDTILASLADSEDSIEEWASDMGKSMAQQMAQAYIDSTYGKHIKELNEEWQKALQDGNQEAMASIQESLEALYKAIGADETLQGLIDKFKTIENPFKDMASTFVSSLMDMNASAEDFANSISKMLTEQMINKIITEGYQTQIDTLGEQWREALESGDSAAIERITQRLTELRGEMGEVVQPLLDAISDINKETDKTFSNMTDSWVSALMDMEGTAEEFAESVGKTMAQKIISEMIAPVYIQPILDAMQNAYNAAVKVQGATVTSVVQTMLPYIEQIKGIYGEIQPMISDLFGQIGITATETAEDIEEIQYALQDMKSNFVSTLMDMKSTTQDFSQDISKILAQSFIEKFLLGDAFDARMKQWQEQYESILGSGMSEDERKKQLRALRDSIATAREDYTKQAIAIQELLGITTEDAQQATMNMADKITYDQADQLLGVNIAQELLLEQILAVMLGTDSTSTEDLVGNIGEKVNIPIGELEKNLVYKDGELFDRVANSNAMQSEMVMASMQALSNVTQVGQDNILLQIALANSHLELIRDYSKNIRDEVLMHLGSIDSKLTHLREL